MSILGWLFGHVHPPAKLEVPPDTTPTWCVLAPGEYKQCAPPPVVRRIAWREDWKCWTATRDREERIITVTSVLPRQHMTPAGLAMNAALEFDPERPEAWIEAACAALKGQP